MLEGIFSVNLGRKIQRLRYFEFVLSPEIRRMTTIYWSIHERE